MTGMVVWRGWTRETPVDVTVIDRGCGAGEIDCIECGGDGDWTKFHPEPHLYPGLKCVECKGTGRVLVAI